MLAVRVANDAEKQMLIAADPEKFFTEPHYNGFPAVLVRLPAIDDEELAELLTDAWRCLAPRALVKAFDAGADMIAIELTANVEQVVSHLVNGVHRDPSQRPLEQRRIVVHDRSFPVGGREAREHVGEQERGVVELAGDAIGLLGGVAVVLDPLVATHRVESSGNPGARAAITRSRCTSSTSRTWQPYSSGDQTSGSGLVRTSPPLGQDRAQRGGAHR